MNGLLPLEADTEAQVVHNAPEKNAKRTNNSHEFALTKKLVATLTFRGTKNNRVVQNLHQDTFVLKNTL